MRCGTALPGAVSGLAVADTEPSSVYTLAEGQLYRCDDAGDQCVLIEGAPRAENTALGMLQGKVTTLLLGHTDSTISRSDDGGTTWTTTEADAAWGGSVDVIMAAHYNIDVAFAGSSVVIPGSLRPCLDRILSGKPFSIRELEGLLTDKGRIGFVRPFLSSGLLTIVEI